MSLALFQFGLIQRNDCASSLIIDVQEKLFSVISDKGNMLENIVKLLCFCKIVDIPVLVCEQTSTEMFIFEALERAGTEEFRQTFKLVKYKLI